MRARTAWLVLVLPFLVLAGMVALLVVRPVFLALTGEDGPVEWGQVVVLALIVGSTAVFARALWRQGWRAPSALYAVITVGALFVLLEEISWGQRIIGLVTPEELGEINRQGEFNVHNILSVQRLLGVAELAVTVYAIAAAAAVTVLRPAIARLYVVVPPLFLAGAFAIPAVYRLSRYTVIREAGQTMNRLAEVAELSLYVGIFLFVVLALRRLWLEAAAPQPEVVPPQGETVPPAAT